MCLSADSKCLFGPSNTVHPEISDLCSAYLKIVGELIYLAVNTCPDISYIINALAQHNATPELHHFVAVKHVLHYLVDTLDLWLHYQSDLDDSCLFAYANASWENESGCWSVSGYTWYYAGGLISHVLKKQSTVALLSTKAEYNASQHMSFRRACSFDLSLLSFVSLLPHQSLSILTILV